MLAVFSDTHTSAAPRLSKRERATLQGADIVLHAGDFTGEESHDSFEQRSARLIAVHGNSDDRRLRERLSSVEIVEWNGWRIVLAHGHEHDRTALPLLGREHEADLAIIGHTHRPGVEWLGDLPVVNPGSHATPRGGPATYATLSNEEAALTVEIRTVEGRVTERQRLLDDE
ncbi:MAG: metallophosphoesterase [archaeon]